jgi:hypothetical protein
MMKSLTALSIFVLLGVCAIVVPSMIPQVKAGETTALAKADRLPRHAADRDCGSQTWPNFEARCLNRGESDVRVREARLVTASR